MADAGSLTGATGANGNTVGGGDLPLRAARVGLDGSVGQGTSETGDWGFCSLGASASTLVKTGPGQLGRIVCGTATGNITIYDGTTSGGVVILAASALVAGAISYNVAFKTGLFIVLSGAGVATATYR